MLFSTMAQLERDAAEGRLNMMIDRTVRGTATAASGTRVHLTEDRRTLTWQNGGQTKYIRTMCGRILPARPNPGRISNPPVCKQCFGKGL